MTGHAVRPECQNVLGGKDLVHLQVTVGAGGLVKRAGIAFDMAVFTGEGCSIRFGLMSCQFERNRIMVEGCGSPIVRSVAASAVRAELAGMCIVPGMAGETIRGRVLKVGIFMAVFASHR